MDVTTGLGDQIAKYLDLSSTQLKITAGNMANLDTPNYKTRGFDFDAAMKRAIDLQPSGATDKLAVAQPYIGNVDGLLSRPDGNDVSMDREGMQMAEAQLKFRTGVEFLRREYTRLLDAIHADTK